MADLNEKLKQDKTGMAITMLVLLCLTLPSAWWTGFVLLKLYGWFILPIQGAPAVTLGNMVGVSLILNLILYNVSKASSAVMEKAESWVDVFSDSFSKMLMVPAIFLFFGWLYQIFFMR